ncbi:MAG: hypothetical protein WBX15_02440 [Thermoanaerobaculia bacterium]
MRPMSLAVTTVAVALIGTISANAACVNKYVARKQERRQILTLLTGMMTFQEAQALSKAIDAKKSPPVKWLDDSGRQVAEQLGELRVVRPMPVACGDKSSGVVVTVDFLTFATPGKTVTIQFSDSLTVTFAKQDE